MDEFVVLHLTVCTIAGKTSKGPSGLADGPWVIPLLQASHKSGVLPNKTNKEGPRSSQAGGETIADLGGSTPVFIHLRTVSIA